MRLEEGSRQLSGDLRRFGAFEDRIDELINRQLREFRPAASQWLVLPWHDGFYLLSEGAEGQRRGREVLSAFLGPSMAALESLRGVTAPQSLPSGLVAAGIKHASRIRRVPGADAGAMLGRLEDMLASVLGRDPLRQAAPLTHVDLLRDLRLSLLQRDDPTARSLLDKIHLSGQMSAENLRFLRIEYLAAFDRWTEMRELPHIGALVRARRPRVITETLLRMIWWSELAAPGYDSRRAAFEERDVHAEFGMFIRSANIPFTAEGREVCFLAALADDDRTRQDAIVGAAADSAEADSLRQSAGLAGGTQVDAGSDSAEATRPDQMVDAFNEGRRREALALFVERGEPAYAEAAVDAVLDEQLLEYAYPILELLRAWVADGSVVVERRLRRDMDELARLVDDNCDGWLEWVQRSAREDRWADAAVVLRDSSGRWESLGSLPASQLGSVANALLSAATGMNEDQVRAALDILCHQAAELVERRGPNEFSHAVLLVLSDQENLSAAVRGAYSDLYSAWLHSAPNATEYREVADLTADIWARIGSPVAVDWLIGILDDTANAPSPDEAVRMALGAQLIADARHYYDRVSLRERAELEALAPSFGLPALPVIGDEDEADDWAKLDGKLIGLYSLLPRAASLLKARLTLLCSPRDVVGNVDEVSTPGLRSLAQRADFMIVDTWHAAHQATGAIDAVRSRDRQILPRQRGISGFLKALQESISA